MRTPHKNGEGKIERPIAISIEAPRPLLDEGEYVAQCTDATVAWARRWKKWIVRLVMVPVDYRGQSYRGDLCKFLSLGQNPNSPHAGAQSEFRKLWVACNGAPNTSSEVDLGMFVGKFFQISIGTVRADRNGKPIDPALWYSVVREVAFSAAAARTNGALKGKVSGLGRTPHTHTQAQTGGAGSHPAPLAQDDCYVHGGETQFWQRGDGGRVCALCHPQPGDTVMVQ
jgi:hypothetical protein